MSGPRERTRREVGAAIGVSAERVREIEASALRKLRRHAALGALVDVVDDRCAERDAVPVFGPHGTTRGGNTWRRAKRGHS